jgi:DNA-binding PadR family transcriptional regulator
MSLRHALLGFLSIRPLSGYDLKRHFDASVRHFWTADQAAIYRALGDLEAAELVRHERIAQSSRPDRKVFHLTEAGRAALDAWLATPTPSSPRREPLLVQLFFAGRIAPEALRDLLRAELAATEAELAGFRGIVAGIEAGQASLDEATQVGPLITITNGVRVALAQREWLRGLLQRQDAGTLTMANLLDELRTLLRVPEP